MPDELSINDILGIFSDATWLDRVTLSKLLKAFAVEPCGKRRAPEGGRPAILYPSASVMAMMEVVNSNRGTL